MHNPERRYRAGQAERRSGEVQDFLDGVDRRQNIRRFDDRWRAHTQALEERAEDGDDYYDGSFVRGSGL